MKGYVIYLFTFFVVISLIKGKFKYNYNEEIMNQQSNPNFEYNPYEEELKRKEKLKQALAKQKKEKKEHLQRFDNIIISSNLKSISSSILKKSIIEKLDKRWFEISNDLDLIIYLTIYDKNYTKESNSGQFKMKTYYTVIGTIKVTSIRSYAYLNTTYKNKFPLTAISSLNFDDCKIKLNKKLYIKIGYDIANILNRKYLYVKNRLN